MTGAIMGAAATAPDFDVVTEMLGSKTAPAMTAWKINLRGPRH